MVHRHGCHEALEGRGPGLEHPPGDPMPDGRQSQRQGPPIGARRALQLPPILESIHDPNRARMRRAESPGQVAHAASSTLVNGQEGQGVTQRPVEFGQCIRLRVGERDSERTDDVEAVRPIGPGGRLAVASMTTIHEGNIYDTVI